MRLKHWLGAVPGKYLLERGMFRFLLLHYLREGPAHGYALMKRIAEDFGGLYVPSPGVIYPTLQLLEDQGYVKCVCEEGKKKYALTAEGEKLLEEKKAVIERLAKLRERKRELATVVSKLWPSVWRLLYTIGAHFDEINEEKAKRIREILERAVDDVEEALAG